MLSTLGMVACSAADNREWMKVDQRYTKQEFVRDHKECSRGGKLDEPCMRQRGWLPVSPSKTDAEPPEVRPPQGRGRY